MTQTRKGSLAEAIVNVLIGAIVALASQMIIFPAYGVHVPLSTDLKIMAWFTVISVTRSYCLRRWFNARIHRALSNGK